MKESEIQKQILDWLKIKKIYHLRLNSGKIKAAYGDKNYIVNLCPEGTPDIFLLHRGKSIFLEIKKNELTQRAWVRKIEQWKKTAYLNDYNRREVAQYKEMQKIGRAGGEAHLVASLKEVEDIINNL